MSKNIEGDSRFAMYAWNEETQKPAVEGLKVGDKFCMEFELLHQNGMIMPVKPHVIAIQHAGLTVFRQPETEKIPEEVIKDVVGKSEKKKVEPKAKNKKPELKIVKEEK